MLGFDREVTFSRVVDAPGELVWLTSTFGIDTSGMAGRIHDYHLRVRI
jgi:hypothetical protein